MNVSRKTWLYVAVVGIAAFFGGDFAWRSYVDGPLEQKKADKEKLLDKIQKKKKDFAKAKKAAKTLEILETSSLPTDHEVARSLYRTWLLELVEKAEFHTPHVDSGPVTGHKGLYDSLAFSVRGKGSLQHVVRFLYDFYRAGHLHRIQTLSLTPYGKSGELDVMITVEALILQGTERSNSLSKLTSNRLRRSSLAEYQIISQRNIFGFGGEPDPTQQAYLTAVTEDAGEPEIWITRRGRDGLLKLHVGEQFEIGTFNGTVVDILEDDVIFESNGDRWLISIGEPFSDALAVPPEY